MAVQMCNPAIVWEGLSTDTKPTPTATLPIEIGSMFYETDTFYHYMWNGVAWVGPIYWLGFIQPFDEYFNGY